jgi:hypothetical protein
MKIAGTNVFIIYLFIYYLQIMNDEWKYFFALADVNSDMI